MKKTSGSIWQINGDNAALHRLALLLALSCALHLLALFLPLGQSGARTRGPAPASPNSITINLPTPRGEDASAEKPADASPPAQSQSTPLPESGLPLGYERYLKTHELTRQPAPLNEVAAPPAQRKGRLRLKILIGVSGKADRIEVIDSNLPINVEASIVSQFWQSPYQPGEVGGQPVKSELLLEVLLEP